MWLHIRVYYAAGQQLVVKDLSVPIHLSMSVCGCGCVCVCAYYGVMRFFAGGNFSTPKHMVHAVGGGNRHRYHSNATDIDFDLKALEEAMPVTWS